MVFFYWKRFYERLPPGGSWRRRRLRESTIQRKLRKLKVTRAPSVTLRVSPSSRRKAYVRAVSLRIVGSGIRPIWRGGRPRAMLAPDTSVGKVEKQLYQGVLDMLNNKLIIVFLSNICYNIITPVINFLEVQYEH